MRAGELSGKLGGVRIPRQREAARGELLGARQIEEGGQQRACLHRPRRGELGDGQHGLRGTSGLALLEVEVGDRGVRGAEIDSNRVAGHGSSVEGGQDSSTSAGASTRGYIAGPGEGNVTAVVTQPWCLRAPLL